MIARRIDGDSSFDRWRRRRNALGWRGDRWQRLTRGWWRNNHSDRWGRRRRIHRRRCRDHDWPRITAPRRARRRRKGFVLCRGRGWNWSRCRDGLDHLDGRLRRRHVGAGDNGRQRGRLFLHRWERGRLVLGHCPVAVAQFAQQDDAEQAQDSTQCHPAIMRFSSHDPCSSPERPTWVGTMPISSRAHGLAVCCTLP
jgi:hypothetical protein